MKVKCIKVEDNEEFSMLVGNKYIVYAIIIDIQSGAISYFLDGGYQYGCGFVFNDRLQITNYEIPAKNWVVSKQKETIVISYPEFANDFDANDVFLVPLIDSESWAVKIHNQRKAQIDAELREINYEKMVGRLIGKLNFLKSKCEKFEFSISNIINLELETKEIKREINFIKDNKNSWLYINAKDNKFEASASSDNLLQILKFGCRWIEGK